MSLWFRLAGVLAKARRGARVEMPDGVSRIALRVWPNDLDFNFHMNNGRYLTIMDLGRVDMMARTGIAGTVLKRRWMPVVTGVTIRYRRSLGLFRRFHLETRLAGWDEHFLFLDQRFVIADGPDAGTEAASARVRATFVDRGRTPPKVPVAELFALLGLDPALPSPPLQDEAEGAGPGDTPPA